MVTRVTKSMYSRFASGIGDDAYVPLTGTMSTSSSEMITERLLDRHL